jgi:hypothetical protein
MFIIMLACSDLRTVSSVAQVTQDVDCRAGSPPGGWMFRLSLGIAPAFTVFPPSMAVTPE